MAEDAAAEEAPEVPVGPLGEEEFAAREAVFQEIFGDCSAEDAKAASKAERAASGLDKPGLTYQEIELQVINRLLNRIKTDHGPLFESTGILLDLGSGAGKACIAAGLLHPFEKVVGIEMLQSLTDMANTALAKYQEAQLPEGVVKPPVEFIKGDFVAEFEEKLGPLIPQVCVGVAAATFFDEEQLNVVTNLAKKMPDGSFLITVTRGLPEALVIDMDRHPAQRRAQAVKKALCARGTDPDAVEIVPGPPENDPNGWTLLFCEEVQLVWGLATCFVYKKVPAEGGGEAPEEGEVAVAAEEE
jgi:SAM-dependent methyltransferase